MIGLNTIKCPDEELEQGVLYRKITLQISSATSDEIKEVEDKINATGIAIVLKPDPRSLRAGKILYCVMLHRCIYTDKIAFGKLYIVNEF